MLKFYVLVKSNVSLIHKLAKYTSTFLVFRIFCMFIFYSRVQCCVHSDYLSTSIFLHAKQTRRIESHESQPTSMTFWTYGSFRLLKVSSNTVLHRLWLAHFEQHIKRRMLKDGCRKIGAMHVTLNTAVNIVQIVHAWVLKNCSKFTRYKTKLYHRDFFLGVKLSSVSLPWHCD